MGLPIAEVYGQTEDCGPATLNPPDAIRIGSVGRAIPGLEIRTASDGELLVRGGSVCSGYFQMPEATAELIDEAGWMTTGDLGRIDGDGYVWLTGRKKDLIINAAGKNIAPSELEARLSMEKLVGQAVVIGEGRRYLTALLTLDPDAAGEWADHHGASADVTDLVHDSRLRETIDAAVETGQPRACAGRADQVLASPACAARPSRTATSRRPTRSSGRWCPNAMPTSWRRCTPAERDAGSRDPASTACHPSRPCVRW